jgi:hypothetical protein
MFGLFISPQSDHITGKSEVIPPEVGIEEISDKIVGSPDGCWP